MEAGLRVWKARDLNSYFLLPIRVFPSIPRSALSHFYLLFPYSSPCLALLLPHLFLFLSLSPEASHNTSLLLASKDFHSGVRGRRKTQPQLGKDQGRQAGIPNREGVSKSVSQGGYDGAYLQSQHSEAGG